MTGEEFLLAVNKLGWTQLDFAKKTGVHRNAINRWVTGKSKVPKLAAAYLRLAIEVQHHAARLQQEINPD